MQVLVLASFSGKHISCLDAETPWGAPKESSESGTALLISKANCCLAELSALTTGSLCLLSLVLILKLREHTVFYANNSGFLR